MDSVTHALAASSLFLAAGRPELVPFAALGSISMDVDILFMRFPEKNPRYYVFTHGGFTHSIAGALLIGTAVFAVTAIFTLAGPLSWLFGAGLGAGGLLALLAGSLTHVFSDFLAYPGIPVLYPFTDRKYTLGIFAGPSLFLLVVSWIYLGTLLLSLTSLADYRTWAAIFVIYVGGKALLKLFLALTTEGITIPTKNPLHWFVIRDEDGSYSILSRNLLGGLTEPRVFPKYRNISPEEAEPYRVLPEIRRHRYNSYITTVEKKGDTITFRDPFRAEGFTRYPFDSATVDVLSGKVVPFTGASAKERPVDER
ncbi:MAG: metal-dependent hydrolase [Methanomicrobiales archaeon]|nr:metal-dependent hydrolase [Methanomicrobiales archaeon]